MPLDKQKLQAISASLELPENKHLAANQSMDPHNQSNGFNQFKRDLAARIQMLIDSDLQKLLQYAYRFDVDETKFWKTLNEETVNERATGLADLFISREVEKERTREAYRQQRLQIQKK